jgi:glycosyltransferase involved in cell wall biosynthesis
MIGHKRIGTREGGAEVVVHELAERLVEQGVEVTVFDRMDGKDYKRGEVKSDIKVKNIPTFRNNALNAFVYSFLSTIVAIFEGYDIIHFHGEGPGAMTFFTWIFHIHSVVTIHGLDWKRDKWGKFASAYLKWSEKMVARFADEIIVLSDNMMEYFNKEYNRKTTFIRNGVTQLEAREPYEIAKFGLEKDKYILYLGRLVPEKGIDYLIDGFKNLKTDKKLVIAGDFSDKNRYINSIIEKTQNDNRIVMTGFVSGELLEELYTNCSVFVLPSKIEGMSLSLLEALSTGARCLVSDIDENHNIADEYITFFRKGDVDDLTERLNGILNSERPEKVKNMQINYMKNSYSWDSVTRETLKIYERVKAKDEVVTALATSGKNGKLGSSRR